MEGHMQHIDHAMHTGHVHSHVLEDNMSKIAHDPRMMMMYFHVGNSETILFKFWKTDEDWEMGVSCLILFVISFLYEALKFGREYIFQRAIRSSRYTSASSNNIAITDGQQPVRYMEQIIMPPAVGMCSLIHALQTFLHMVQFLISYMLMLVFMTYNVWLCLAVVLGAGLGYFVFGWRKPVVVDITEHCH